MTRRRYFGTISSLGNDSSGTKVWRLRWYERGRRHTKSVHGSYREAEKELARIHAAADERRRSGATVGEIYNDYYLPDAARTKAPNTRRRLKSVYDAHIAPRWADVPVAAVKASEVESWLSKMTFGTAAGALAIMRWVMRKAVMLEYIDASPIEIKITLPDDAKRQPKTIIAGDSVDAYYAAVRGTLIEAAWILCIAGGLRSGESLGVKVGEIVFREIDGIPFAAVPVNRSAAQNGGLSIDDRTDSERLKTTKSLRWAIIREPWASRLMELQDEAASCGSAYITDDGFGNPQGTNWLLRTARSIYSKNNLEIVTIRNLRASYATYAHHDLNLPTEDVARLMGHSRPVITWGVYERPTLEQIATSVVKG